MKLIEMAACGAVIEVLYLIPQLSLTKAERLQNNNSLFFLTLKSLNQ